MDGKKLIFVIDAKTGVCEFDTATKQTRPVSSRATAAPFWMISRDGKYVAQMANGGIERLLQLLREKNAAGQPLKS